MKWSCEQKFLVIFPDGATLRCQQELNHVHLVYDNCTEVCDVNRYATHVLSVWSWALVTCRLDAYVLFLVDAYVLK